MVDVGRCKRGVTYKIGTAEAVQDSDAVLAVGKDLSIFNLLEDDAVLVLEIMTRHTAIDGLHHFSGFLMLPL